MTQRDTSDIPRITAFDDAIHGAFANRFWEQSLAMGQSIAAISRRELGLDFDSTSHEEPQSVMSPVPVRAISEEFNDYQAALVFSCSWLRFRFLPQQTCVARLLVVGQAASYRATGPFKVRAGLYQANSPQEKIASVAGPAMRQGDLPPHFAHAVQKMLWSYLEDYSVVRRHLKRTSTKSRIHRSVDPS